MATIDRMEFDLLYRKNYLQVRNFVARHGFCDATAEDIVQDSFVNAWEKRSSLSSVDTFVPWVRAISRNLCFRYLRSKFLVCISDLKSQSNTSDTLDLGDREEFVNWYQNQNDHCWTQEEREHALGAIACTIKQMPESPRKRIGMLFYLEQKTVHQITILQNMKQNTVLSHLRRFRQELARELLAYEPCPESLDSENSCPPIATNH